jgi:hypothetical protein
MNLAYFIGNVKIAHIAHNCGEVPAHIYVPRWVAMRLEHDMQALAELSGAEMRDARLTHIHGMQIHVLDVLDATDVMCAVYKDPI